MYKVVFYVPVEYKEFVKASMFSAGGGRFRKYDSCSWEVRGEGQFRPLDGSNPFIGKANEIEHVEEYRVEMICEDEKIVSVLQALIDSHPYEEPAYEAFRIHTLGEIG